MSRGPLAAAFALVLSLAALASVAEAAPAGDVEGYVLTMDSGDVVVDVGKLRGAAVGDSIELWRPLKLKHPVTGKTIVDRFRIGTLKLVQVRDQLSLAQPDGALARPVAAGDVVILRGTGPLLPAPPATPAAAPSASSAPIVAPPAPSADPEAERLARLFDQLHGASIEKRIAAYEAYVKQFPDSRFRRTLEEEALALRAILERPDASPSTKTPQPTSLSFEAPKEIVEGGSITLAIEIVGDIKGAILQLRSDGETAYAPIPMKAAGPRYYRVVLPKDRVRAPGLSYFVEAVLPNGTTVPVEGTAAAPRSAKVDAAPTIAPPPKWLSTAAVWSDYADYNRLLGNDWAWQTEGYFGMRFADVGLRAVRSGFGVYKGQGGSLEELDSPKNDPRHRPPRGVGLSYGYIEGEWGIAPTWGLAGRAIVGLTEDGVTGGAQAFVRIGNDRKTNLMIGGELLGGVGLRGITQFQLEVFPRFPILFRSEVTNQPAGSELSTSKRVKLESEGLAIGTADLGVRAILQLGWRAVLLPEKRNGAGVTFFLRGSYQGRTINHAGPGVGAGAQVEW